MRDVRGEAGRLGQRDQVRLAGLASGDPWFVACLAQTHRLMCAFVRSGDGAGGADQQHQRIDAETFGVQIRIVHGGQRIVAERDRAIRQSLVQGVDGLGRLHLHQADSDIRRLADMHQHARHERRAHRWGSDEPDMRGTVAPVLLKIPAGLGETVLDELPVVGQDPARRRELHAM